MSVLYWPIVLAALVGVWLNIRKHVACFWIWAVTNATWAVVDYLHGIYAQAALQAVYFRLHDDHKEIPFRQQESNL